MVRSTAMIVVSFVMAGIVVWFSPLLFDKAGLGEFTFLGQLVAAIVVLSVLESAFRRLGEPPEH